MLFYNICDLCLRVDFEFVRIILKVGFIYIYMIIKINYNEDEDGYIGI